MSEQLESLERTFQSRPDVEVRFVDAARPQHELVEACRNSPAVIVGMGVGDFTVAVATQLPDLRLIQTLTAGLDYLDAPGFRNAGFDVRDNGGANAPAVAEHAVALMVMVQRAMVKRLDSVRDGTWGERLNRRQEEYRTLVGLQAGIIGLGRIGSRVGARLHGWKCALVYHDSADFDAAYEDASGARRVTLDELLETSDVVTLHVPLDDSTHHMMSGAQFDQMKDSAILINTARGPVVDQAALLAALEAGGIGGCGLDVLETEPIDPDDPLVLHRNAVITPHMATRSIQSQRATAENAARNIAEVLGSPGSDG